MNVGDGNKRVLFFQHSYPVHPLTFGSTTSGCSHRVIQLLLLIELGSCKAPIPFRVVGLVELFLGAIHRPGVRSIVVLAWFQILP